MVYLHTIESLQIMFYLINQFYRLLIMFLHTPLTIWYNLLNTYTYIEYTVRVELYEQIKLKVK